MDKTQENARQEEIPHSTIWISHSLGYKKTPAHAPVSTVQRGNVHNELVTCSNVHNLSLLYTILTCFTGQSQGDGGNHCCTVHRGDVHNELYSVHTSSLACSVTPCCCCWSGCCSMERPGEPPRRCFRLHSKGCRWGMEEGEGREKFYKDARINKEYDLRHWEPKTKPIAGQGSIFEHWKRCPPHFLETICFPFYWNKFTCEKNTTKSILCASLSLPHPRALSFPMPNEMLKPFNIREKVETSEE